MSEFAKRKLAELHDEYVHTYSARERQIMELCVDTMAALCEATSATYVKVLRALERGDVHVAMMALSAAVAQTSAPMPQNIDHGMLQ